MTTQYHHPEAIVDAAWLVAHLDDPNLRIYECTTYLDPPTAGSTAPYTVRNARVEYAAGHIPGAALIDLQADLCTPSAPHLRFMMPPPDAFRDACLGVGIGDDSRVVLYSRASPSWATRVWWMLRAIGFDNAAVLDGGFARWTLDGHPVSTEAMRYPRAGALGVSSRANLFVGRQEVQAAIGDPSTCTLNALSPEHHRGEDPRYGRAGRVPGSVNLPASSLADAADTTFCPAAFMRELLQEIGAEPAAKMIVYCGGGIAASLDAFLLYQLGYDDVAVYDASMSEWANDESLPMETG